MFLRSPCVCLYGESESDEFCWRRRESGSWKEKGKVRGRKGENMEIKRKKEGNGENK